MTTLTLDDLKKQWSVNPQEASGFLLLLAKLEVGDVLQAPCMRVEKLEGDTFKLFLTDQDIETLVQDLAEVSVDPLMAMMGKPDD